MTAVTQNTTFQFEIQNEGTLILLGSGDGVCFAVPVNTRFVLGQTADFADILWLAPDFP